MYRVAAIPVMYPLHDIEKRMGFWFRPVLGMSFISTAVFLTADEAFGPSFDLNMIIGRFVGFWFIQVFSGLFWNGAIEVGCFMFSVLIKPFTQRWLYGLLRLGLCSGVALRFHWAFWPRFSLDYPHLWQRTILLYGSWIGLPLLVYGGLHWWSVWKQPFQRV